MTYQIYDGPTHISVCWRGEDLSERGTAEADHYPYEGFDGRWHIARVLIQPDTLRGMGIGSGLLTRLKKAVRTYGGTHLTVAPGGYNMDPEKQRAFYRKSGFEDHSKDGLMICWLREI